MLKVDNGNVTVVLDHMDYQQKMQELLKDKVYWIKTDPMGRMEQGIGKFLKATEWTDDVLTALKSSSSCPPWLYGLAKNPQRKLPVTPHCLYS